jgi:HlyD family secretion protein
MRTVNPKPAFNWRRMIGAAAVVVVLAALFFRGNNAAPVRVAAVEHGSVRSQISTNGKVEPIRDFEAHAPAATTVERVYVREGQRVKKGQLLLELNDADAHSMQARATAQMRTAEAELNAVHNGGTQEEVLAAQAEFVKARADRDSAQRNLDALHRLVEQGAASAGEVREAEAQLQRTQAQLKFVEQKRTGRYSPAEVSRAQAQITEAQAALAATQELLAKSHIRAPQDGIVYALPVREGAFVNPGDLLLQEADLSQVTIRAFVDEPDIGRLQTSQRIEVTWDALPGQTWSGSVSMIPASVKLRGSRNVGELTCIVGNQDSRLLPNINVSVAIITAEHSSTLYLPREAVRVTDGKAWVYQITDGKLKQREVKTGISSLTQVEVQDLPEKSQVVLTTLNGKPLVEGMAVAVPKR